MQILIPMVGLGKRFADEGYTLPKPLIDVDGLPMVVRVLRDLPDATGKVFVVNSNHVNDFQIDRVLREYFPTAQVVVSDGITEGQACSTALGCGCLDPEDSVLVAACDNTHIFSNELFSQKSAETGPDVLIWTYRSEPRVIVHPEWYGWVDANESGAVQNVSVKKPISPDLMNDHVVSGTFWFRSPDDLQAGIKELVDRDIRVNGEFYLDSVPNVLIESGKRVEVFEVEKYIGWGTPGDYEDYQRWSRYLQQARAAA